MLGAHFHAEPGETPGHLHDVYTTKPPLGGNDRIHVGQLTEAAVQAWRKAAQGAGATLRPFTRELRRLGFERQYRQRHQDGDVTEFRATRGDRFVTVQLWSDGSHRAAHGTRTGLESGIIGEHETTCPTNFRDVQGMLRAIAYEWARPSGPGSPDLK